jgi:hypothetical protein
MALLGVRMWFKPRETVAGYRKTVVSIIHVHLARCNYHPTDFSP